MPGDDQRPRDRDGSPTEPVRRRGSPRRPERVAHYRIEGELGRGGMGVVYRGWDERLERPVAVKGVPDHVARDRDLLARLGREARSLAAVNHPAVATIYGLEEEDGRPYLVMELVEGEALTARLARGPLTHDELYSTCAQVAAALAAAHEKGLVHRDLKPGNVMVGPGGLVKLLDFGLARAPDQGAEERLTESGIVLGTPGYMSPEALRGEEVDYRVDAWAFGCLAFECLVGQLAFPGRTTAERVAATLERDPDWSALPGDVPDALVALLRRCMAKAPARRLSSLREAREILEDLQVAQRAGHPPRATPELAPTGTVIASRETRSGEQAVPDVVGPARVLRPLGPSGAYLAELVEDRPGLPSGSRVVVHVRDATSHGWGMPTAEGRHPGLVRVVECGTLGSGAGSKTFLVAEHVHGHTLAELRGQLGTLPEALVRQVGARVAEALAVMHETGAAHGALAAERVLVTPEHEVKLRGWSDSPGRDPAAASVEGDLRSLGALLHEAATGAAASGGTDSGVVAALVPARQLNHDLSPFFDVLVGDLLSGNAAELGGAAGVARVLEEGESSPWWRVRRAALAPWSVPRLRVARAARLVEREAELSALREAVDRVGHGQGGVLLLEGEPGVGKSRLVDELLSELAEAHEGVRVLCARHGPEGATAGLEPVARGIVEALGEADLDVKIATHIASTPRLAPAFAALLLGQPPPSGALPLSPEAARSAFETLFRAFADHAPLVVVFEDLHFAGAESRSVLLSLAAEAATRPLLVLATTRTASSPELVAHLERCGTVRRVALDRLTPDGVRGLLGATLGSEDLAASLAPLVGARSDGNPYFVLEVVAELEREGTLRRLDGGGYASTGSVLSVDVPSSIRSLVEARLDAVSREDRELLDLAAVQGFAFDPDLLARVLERRRLAVLQSLAELERRSGVVRSSGRRFEFDHHHLQEVVREAMPPLLRVEYHALLADALAERERLTGHLGDAQGDAAVFLAEHYVQGERLERAAEVLGPALAHLMATHQLEGAVRLASLAADADGLSPDLRAEAELQRSWALGLLGRPEERAAALDGAVRWAREAGDEPRARRALRQRALLDVYLGEHERAEAELVRLADEAAAACRPREEASALHALATCLVESGRYEAADDRLRRCLELAREAGDEQLELVATAVLGNAWLQRGRLEQALEIHEAAVASAKSSGAHASEASSRTAIGTCLLGLGRAAAAGEALAVALDMFREVGHRSGEARVLNELGPLHAEAGALAEARATLERARRLTAEIGYAPGTVAVALNLVTVDLLEGRLEEARERLQACGSVAAARRVDRLRRRSGFLEGELLAREGRWAEARTRLGEGVEEHREAGDRLGLARAALALARVSLQSGDVAEARELLREASELTRAEGYADPGPLPDAWLALTGSAGSVDVPEEAPVAVRAEAHAVLEAAGIGEAGRRDAALARLVVGDAGRFERSGLPAFLRSLLDAS